MDIYYADMASATGAETDKIRPVIVVCRKDNLVGVVPISTKFKNKDTEFMLEVSNGTMSWANTYNFKFIDREYLKCKIRDCTTSETRSLYSRLTPRQKEQILGKRFCTYDRKQY